MRIYKLGLGVQFIFHIVKYKLKRYKSLRDLYLFAKVWCGEKITRRADCANKRGIYKLGLDYLRKFDVWGENYKTRRLRK